MVKRSKVNLQGRGLIVAASRAACFSRMSQGSLLGRLLFSAYISPIGLRWTTGFLCSSMLTTPNYISVSTDDLILQQGSGEMLSLFTLLALPQRACLKQQTSQK